MFVFVFIFSFFVIVFLSGLGSAFYADCNSNSARIIFRLSAENNAHASEYNSPASAPITICIDDIFPNRVYPASPSRGATSNDDLFYISNGFNAHGDSGYNLGQPTDPGSPYFANYFGGLSCIARNNACLSTEVPLVALSSDHNAHFAAPGTAGYSVLICCDSSIPCISGFTENANGQCTSGSSCGNNVCESGSGENAGTCATDCAPPGTFSVNSPPTFFCSGVTNRVTLTFSTSSNADAYGSYYCTGVGCPLPSDQTSTSIVSFPSDAVGGFITKTFDLPSSGYYRFIVRATNPYDQTHADNFITSSNIVEGNAPSCGSTAVINVAEWRRIDGGVQVLTDSNVNQTVRLYVSGSNLPTGAKIRLEIYEEDVFPLPNDDILIGTSAPVLNVVNGVGYYDWFISDGAMTSSSSDEGLNSDREFKFKATVLDSGGNVLNPNVEGISNELKVSETPGPNLPPIANISAPVDRGIYFQGTSVLFNQSSFDPNGPSGLIYKWTIDEDNYQDAKHNFTYDFNSAGQKTVTLRVTDSGGKWDEQQVSILVLGSPGALAYIDAPRHREVVPATLIPGQSGTRLNITYNGTSSFIIDSDGANPCPAVTCLAGICPLQTQNNPTAVLCVGKPNITLTGIGGNLAFTNTNFTWKFSDGFTIVNRTGVANAVGNKVFGSKYAGEARINLSVQYANSGIGVASTTQRIFTLGQCVNNGNTWIVKDANGKKTGELTTTDATNGCLGGDGQNGTSDDCCPNGWGCLKDGGDSDYRCRQLANLNTTDICSQQTSQGSCLNVSRNILMTDPLWGINRCDEINSTTGNIIECGCIWKTGSPNRCIFSSSSLDNDGGNTWSCSSTYSQSECVNGYATLNIDNTFLQGDSILNSTQAGCDDEIRQVLCGRPVVELPFFGNSQLVVAVLLIVGIYLVLSLRHKRRR